MADYLEEQVWCDVPCFDIECRLAVKLEQQAKKVEGNDVFDISALTAAVPYCDAVVTEAFWVNLCKQSGVSSKYNARLFSSLAQVYDWLKGEAPNSGLNGGIQR